MKLITSIISIFLIISQFSSTKADDEDNSIDFQQIYPKNLQENNAYKKFIKTIEENKMNVTVVLSSVEKYNNKKNKIKEIYSAAITFPVNNVELKKTNFKETDKTYLKLAKNSNLIANIRTTKIQNGELFDETLRSNMLNGTTMSAAHKYLSFVKKGKKGFQVEDDTDSILAQYIFFTPEGTTKVHFGKLKTDVEQSKDMSDEEINFITDILFKINYIYESYDTKARMIVHRLEEKFPKYNWQVVTDIDKDSYIDSSKFSTVQVLSDKYTIFAI